MYEGYIKEKAEKGLLPKPEEAEEEEEEERSSKKGGKSKRMYSKYPHTNWLLSNQKICTKAKERWKGRKVASR
jgi:hypothetical protein